MEPPRSYSPVFLAYLLRWMHSPLARALLNGYCHHLWWRWKKKTWLQQPPRE
jgi:hypothetical protein